MSRRGDARAGVRILDVPPPEAPRDGSVTTRQAAAVTLPRSELDRVWNAEHLERLAATYWRFLTRVTLGLVRVLYTPDARELVLLRRPLTLLRFRAPEYELAEDRGTVTWPITGGLLVLPSGRDRGHLRLSVRHPKTADPEGTTTLTVTSEVASFHPLLAGRGRAAGVGRHVYRLTQLQLHVVVTHAFLRSLARLDLVRSRVGALAPPADHPREAVSRLARR